MEYPRVLSGDFDLSEGVLQDLVWYYHIYQYVDKAKTADMNFQVHMNCQEWTSILE